MRPLGKPLCACACPLLKPGRPPLRGAKGVELYVICEGGMRPAVSAGGSPDEMGEKPAAEVTKEEIENRLFNQELSMLSRRYLRDLRRDATIEIKEN